MNKINSKKPSQGKSKRTASYSRHRKTSDNSRKYSARKDEGSSERKQTSRWKGSSRSQEGRDRYPRRNKTLLAGKTLIGIVKRHPGGFGFVIPEKSGFQDVYVPASQIGSALTNDRVEVCLNERRGRRFYGAIKNILKRHWEFISGPYEVLKGKEVLRSHGLGFDQPIELKNPLKIPAKKGDWLKVKITHYPENHADFKGKIIHNLGCITSVPGDDNLRALAKQNIVIEFSKEALKEVEKIPDEVNKKDFKKRVDLTSKFFVTIDGATARDFDDSIFVETLPEGFRLFVAIADVSYYVKEDSVLDKEAFLRGNSTYLPNLVVPMLPEKLSNHLCSLNPQEDRLALVSEMEFDFSGEMTKSSFYEAIIKSKRRLIYGEVQEMIDGQIPFEDCGFLREAKKLADILIKRQIAEGALDFNLPETVIKVNSQGIPLDIMRGHRLFSHRLIEQFMLAANKASAGFLKQKGYPVVYRIHDSPKKEKLQQLEMFSKNLGFALPVHSREGLLQLLKQYKDHPKELFINKLVLRSMAQACYSASNKGHYGLHAPLYTHFTSPIRRYCDLMIHRFLKQALREELLSENKKDLEAKGAFISGREQASVKAERQVYDIKKARFLKNRLGEDSEGTVSSVTSFGLFIALKEYDIEGLVRFKDLPGHWIGDEMRLRAVANRSHYSINFGDEVSVRLASVDEINGRIDFQLLTHKNQNLPKGKAQNGVDEGSFKRERGQRGKESFRKDKKTQSYKERSRKRP